MGFTVTLQSESTANWEVEKDRWTVPINSIFCQAAVVRCVPRELPARCRGLCGASRGRTVVESPRRHRHPPAAAIAFEVAIM